MIAYRACALKSVRSPTSDCKDKRFAWAAMVIVDIIELEEG